MGFENLIRNWYTMELFRNTYFKINSHYNHRALRTLCLWPVCHLVCRVRQLHAHNFSQNCYVHPSFEQDLSFTTYENIGIKDLACEHTTVSLVSTRDILSRTAILCRVVHMSPTAKHAMFSRTSFISNSFFALTAFRF